VLASAARLRDDRLTDMPVSSEGPVFARVTILDGDSVRKVRDLLARGAFEDGRLTASGQAASTKKNLQLSRNSEVKRQADAILNQAFSASEAFANAAFPNKVAPFTYNRYDVGMTYGAHVDAPFPSDGRMRSDIALTLFLSEPESYDGGELVVQDGPLESKIKFAAGEAVVYPASSVHRVESVTRGVRLAAITWIQSFVPDIRHRRVLSDLLEVKALLERTQPEGKETVTLRNAFYNLMRLWWQP
jgi:PKHD-type hydroxylase